MHPPARPPDRQTGLGGKKTIIVAVWWQKSIFAVFSSQGHNTQSSRSAGKPALLRERGGLWMNLTPVCAFSGVKWFQSKSNFLSIPTHSNCTSSQFFSSFTPTTDVYTFWYPISKWGGLFCPNNSILINSAAAAAYRRIIEMAASL